jgi:hypothetical protein
MYIQIRKNDNGSQNILKMVDSILYSFEHTIFYIIKIIYKFIVDEEDSERPEWDWLKKK